MKGAAGKIARMMELLRQQYKLMQSARAVVFGYADTLSPGHFTQELAAFGGGSIRHLLVHTANTYQFWLTNFAQGRELPFVQPALVPYVNDVRQIFRGVNALTEEFLTCFQGRGQETITGFIPWRRLTLETTPLALFTHVLTHESHHKGQLLSMSRQLGYTPPDTDLIRF